MTSWKLAFALAAISLHVAVALAAAQQPVRPFDRLDTRLKPGDSVWVTGADNRELKGRIGAITAEALTLEGGSSHVFRASDVRVVRRRAPGRRTDIGMAIGALAGLGGGIAACAAYPKDDPLRGDACLMSIGLLWIPGLGAGALVGAVIPGKKVVVYRAPAPGGAPTARLSIAPVVTPRTKGVAVSFAF